MRYTTFLMVMLGVGSAALALPIPPSYEFQEIFQIKAVEAKASDFTTAMTERNTGTIYFIDRDVVVDTREIERAGVSKAALNLGLSPRGLRKLREYSVKNIGKRLAVLLNGEVITSFELTAPTVHDIISIGGLSYREIRRLSESINFHHPLK